MFPYACHPFAPRCRFRDDAQLTMRAQAIAECGVDTTDMAAVRRTVRQAVAAAVAASGGEMSCNTLMTVMDTLHIGRITRSKWQYIDSAVAQRLVLAPSARAGAGSSSASSSQRPASQAAPAQSPA
eukprot:15479523-Alexandrium_andersonii.AAC.1